jgi:hypothetical protein
MFLTTLFLLLQGAAAPADLKGLEFVAGAWEGDLGGMRIEEHWMKPDGDAMLGMFRMVQKGRTTLTELCAFERRPQGIVLLLRHFGPALVAREEKDQALEFTLEKLEPGRAVFLQKGVETRLTYEKSGADGLTATLDKAGRKTPFVYRRIRTQ